VHKFGFGVDSGDGVGIDYYFPILNQSLSFLFLPLFCFLYALMINGAITAAAPTKNVQIPFIGEIHILYKFFKRSPRLNGGSRFTVKYDVCVLLTLRKIIGFFRVPMSFDGKPIVVNMLNLYGPITAFFITVMCKLVVPMPLGGTYMLLGSKFNCMSSIFCA
jgi:hypothetical protein